MNYEAIDSKRILINSDYIHVTRYIKLTEYDCKFWIKDIREAGVYEKKKFGKAKLVDGGKSSYVKSWHILHIILKDGSEQEVPLLGMVWFERHLLKNALIERGVPSFETSYRLKEGGTLRP